MNETSNEAKARVDWRLVTSVYRQCSLILSDEKSTFLPNLLVGFLAQALERVSSFYEGSEGQLPEDLYSAWAEVEEERGPKPSFRDLYFDTRFSRFLAYEPEKENIKRRPRPFEAAVETSRRLRDLTEVSRALSDLPTAALLGGSSSYGRFFNVSGASRNKSSDIDLLLIVDSYSRLNAVAEALERVDGVREDSLRRMSDRAAVFDDIECDGRCIFSQKIDLWADDDDPMLAERDIASGYRLSLHVFSEEDFDHLVLVDTAAIDEEDAAEPTSRAINDYRESEPDREDHQRSFAGVDLRLERPFHRVDRGFVAESRVFYISQEGRYFPGLMQNLILPRFDVRWDEMPLRPIRRKVEGFRWKMIERLREERRRNPYEFLRLSLSHTRSDVFVPHVISTLDAGLYV